MTNTFDITTLSDAALDVILEAKANPDATIVIDHLSTDEQRAVFAALKITVPASYFLDVSAAPKDSARLDSRDYEGAILRQAEERYAGE